MGISCILRRGEPTRKGGVIKNVDFVIENVSKRPTNNFRLLSLMLRSSSLTLKAAVLAQTLESAEVLTRAKRRVARISSTMFISKSFSEHQCRGEPGRIYQFIIRIMTPCLRIRTEKKNSSASYSRTDTDK